MSRQQRWQLRKQKAGKCIICGKPRVTNSHCKTHASAASKHVMLRMKKNPNKARARAVVLQALERGSLKRGHCHCGALGEAHHEDYSKPLKITWLCVRHHKALHGKAHRTERQLILDPRARNLKRQAGYRDKKRGGRPPRPNNAKLDRTSATDIKAALVAKSASRKELARKYGVCVGTVHAIALNKTWTHIPWPTE